jgi:transposase
MNIANLLVASHPFRVQAVVVSPKGITVRALSMKTRAVCPPCQHLAGRIHSHYVRRVADLPWWGMAVRLELPVRRFLCAQVSCRQRIFCERMPTLVAPPARRTVRLNTALQRVSFALGGEAGARLMTDLARAVSADTLLRRIRQALQPPPYTPRVLGVDDGAKRKGHSYGTILVDWERRTPIDLLPDREAPTLQQGLQGHPGVEVISRDRASKYAEGARAGAPQAVQVADRWQVLKNLGEAVKRILTRQRTQIDHAVRQLRARQLGQLRGIGTAALSLLARPRTDIERHRAQRYARSCAVKRLQQHGVSPVGIARTLCRNHATGRRFMRANTFPERVQ